MGEKDYGDPTAHAHSSEAKHTHRKKERRSQFKCSKMYGHQEPSIRETPCQEQRSCSAALAIGNGVNGVGTQRN